MTTPSNFDRKINELAAGESIVISEFNGVVCSAERTGCGKWVKFVRTFADGSFTVFNKTRF